MQTKPSIYLRWQGYYDYDKENVQNFVLKEPPLAGVYKIAELEAFGSLVPFYVGESKNLFISLMNHLSKEENNLCLTKALVEKNCSFKFAPLIDEKERRIVLYTLYQHYKPSCNNPQDIQKTVLADINFH